MATVTLPCGHDVDVDHSMGERRVWCEQHRPPLEHVVHAQHRVAVSYTARQLTPAPTPEVAT